MGLPADGFEGMYRNRIEDVASLLDEYHKNHYLVVNLSEINYDYSKFHHNVIDCGFPDHHPPQLHMLFLLCKALKIWMDRHQKNTIAVHCKV